MRSLFVSRQVVSRAKLAEWYDFGRVVTHWRNRSLGIAHACNEIFSLAPNRDDIFATRNGAVRNRPVHFELRRARCPKLKMLSRTTLALDATRHKSPRWAQTATSRRTTGELKLHLDFGAINAKFIDAGYRRQYRLPEASFSPRGLRRITEAGTVVVSSQPLRTSALSIAGGVA